MSEHTSTDRSGQIVAIGRVSPAVTIATLGPWASQALCAQADPETFFPPAGDLGTRAREICHQCPVSTQCLAFALSNNEQFGIWGGLDARERAALLRRLRQRKPECGAQEGAA